MAHWLEELTLVQIGINFANKGEKQGERFLFMSTLQIKVKNKVKSFFSVPMGSVLNKGYQEFYVMTFRRICHFTN